MKEALKAIRDWTLKQPDTVWFDEITTLHDFCDNALTAAAEVGDDPRWVEIAGQGVQVEHELRKQLLTIEAHTIKRCAQVLARLAGEPSQPAIKASAYETGVIAILALLKDKQP